MRNISEVLDAQIRGESVMPNPNNRVTTKRKNTNRNIIAKANGDPNAAYAIAMNEIENYVPRLQEFVLEHSEEPAPEIPDLVKQVYQLRMQDANDLSEMIGYDNEQAVTFMEQQEDTFEQDYGYIQDSFLGSVWSPIEIAYQHMTNPADHLDATLLSSVTNVIGTKVNSATLTRAAQGKPAGVLGTLSTGGTAHYNALRTYFRNNPVVAQQVIKGQITDESELPGWVTPTANPNLVGQIGVEYGTQKIKQYLPYIIIGIIVLIAIVYFAAHKSKK